MELTVLVDNNVLYEPYLSAEAGLSLLIRDQQSTVLFDTGYSDMFIKNAARLGKTLRDLDYLVLSHNHLDHTWGLEPLIRYFTELEGQRQSFKRPTLIAHPDVFVSVSGEGFSEIGCLLSEKKLAKHVSFDLSSQPRALSSRLTFLGEIPRRNDFEGTVRLGRKEGASEDDQVIDDSALVYQTSIGLIIITGCSHAGICNIIDYAIEVCGDSRIVDVVGGFHLRSPTQQQLDGTLAYFRKLQPAALHACHCTDLASKIALAGVAPVKETGVGLIINYAD